MTADFIARALKARRSGAGWMAKCPAHDDNNPSLSIRQVDGKVLLHCHMAKYQDEPNARVQVDMPDFSDPIEWINAGDGFNQANVQPYAGREAA